MLKLKKSVWILKLSKTYRLIFSTPLRDVPSIKTPGRTPTNPGCEFMSGSK